MNMRNLAKKKIPKVVDGRQEAAIAAVHKSPEELQALANEYSENVGFAGGTVARVTGPMASEMSSIASQIETSGADRLLKSALTKIQAGAEVPDAVKKAVERLMKSKGK